MKKKGQDAVLLKAGERERKTARERERAEAPRFNDLSYLLTLFFFFSLSLSVFLVLEDRRE